MEFANTGWHDLTYAGRLDGPFHSSDKEKALCFAQLISDRSKKRIQVFQFPVFASLTKVCCF